MEFITKLIILITNLNLQLFNNIILILIVIVVFILSLKINNKFFSYLQNKKKEDNELTTLEVKKIKSRQIIIVVFLILMFGAILVNNFNNFISLFSIFSFMIIIAMKEQVSNIIIGLLIKIPYINTAIKEKEIIIYNTINYKILKVKLFKTFLLNLKNEEILSLPNSELINNSVIHNPIKTFETIKFEYILPLKKWNKDNIIIEEKIETIIMDIIKNDIKDFNTLKKNVGKIKYHYDFFPNIKENYSIEYVFLNKNEISIIVNIKRFNYNFKDYNCDFKKIYNSF